MSWRCSYSTGGQRPLSNCNNNANTGVKIEIRINNTVDTRTSYHEDGSLPLAQLVSLARSFAKEEGSGEVPIVGGLKRCEVMYNNHPQAWDYVTLRNLLLGWQ